MESNIEIDIRIFHQFYDILIFPIFLYFHIYNLNAIVLYRSDIKTEREQVV